MKKIIKVSIEDEIPEGAVFIYASTSPTENGTQRVSFYYEIKEKK